MQRKDYYSTIQNLFCSWINPFLSFIFSPFIFLKTIVPSPEDTCTSSHIQTLWITDFSLGLSDIPDIWDNWMRSYTTTLIQEIHSVAERAPPCSLPPCSTLSSGSWLAFTWYVTPGNICRRKLTCLIHPLPPNHSPNVTHIQLWRWSPSPRQAAGQGWRRAKWPFLELMLICLRLQWAWKCYTRVCF